MKAKFYLDILWRKKWTVGICMATLPLAGFLLFVFVPNLYQSKAKLLIQMVNYEPLLLNRMNASFGQIYYTDKDKAMNNVEEILEGDPVVTAAITTMDLRHHGKLLKTNDFVDPSIFTLMRKGKGVDVENLSVSDVFEIRGYSTDPSEAKVIAETVVGRFRSEFARRYKASVTNVREIMEGRISEVKAMIGLKDEEISQYKKNSRVYDVSIQTNSMVNELSQLKEDMRKLQRGIAENQSSLKDLIGAPWADQDFKVNTVSVEDSPLIDEYKKQLVALETNVSKLRVEKTPDHPEVKIAQDQINVVKENIRSEISKSFRSQMTANSPFYNKISGKYADLVTSRVGMQASLQVLENQTKAREMDLNRLPEEEKKLNELLEESTRLKQMLASLYTDTNMLKSAEKLNVTNDVIIQPPGEGKLYFPPEKDDWIIFIPALGAVGLFLGCLFAFLFDYLEDNITTKDTAKKHLGYEKIIEVSTARNFHISHYLSHEPLKSLPNSFSRLKLLRKPETCKVIAFVGATKKAGTSLVATCASQALAEGGMRVLLIEGNLRSPDLHNLFRTSNERGMGDFLGGQIEAGELRKKTKHENIDVIVGGSAAIDNVQRHLHSERFAKLIDLFKQEYDFIFLSSPPFSDVDDGLILSFHTREAILVMGKGWTPKAIGTDFLQTYQAEGINVRGIVLR